MVHFTHQQQKESSIKYTFIIVMTCSKNMKLVKCLLQMLFPDNLTFDIDGGFQIIKKVIYLEKLKLYIHLYLKCTIL